jgi:N-acetyl-alpha-D-glucosaminyl L-malate synthase BshA
MRIGIMCLASFGGSMVIATQLAKRLAERGHRVHLFARTTPFGAPNRSNGVQLHTVKADLEAEIHPASLYTDWADDEFELFLSKILDVIATEGLDVLHFHYAVPFAFLAAELKRRLEWTAPLLVGTLHGTDVSVYGRDPVKGPQLAQALYELDELTTVSDSHARLATDLFELPSPPRVIPNFIDLSKFQPIRGEQSIMQRGAQEREPLPRYEQRLLTSLRAKPKIVHVSNFRPVKDPQSVARIFLGIREQIEAELWLIGDGPEMGGVKSMLEQSGFERDVRYWNLQRDVAGLLAQTDLLLMTSLSESFCLAALEAMACGVPVLATDVGGLSEVVAQGKTGYLFPVGEHRLAVRLAVDLLSDHGRHRAMSEAAARHATYFGDERIVPAYEDLYRRLLWCKSNRFHILPAYHEASLC